MSDKSNDEKLKKVEDQIEDAKKAGANLLLPSTNIGELSDFHAPVVDSVILSSNPKDGDVYPASYGDDCDEFRITAQGLRKLAVCAGIMWNPQLCRRIDDRSDRNYVAFQAVGGIRKADGTPVWFRGEYDLDFEVLEEELTEQYRGKCKNWKKPDNEKQGYIDNNVRRDMIFKRKHRRKLVETGSMNRVIRAILGLKNSYSREELLKPFIMIRIVFRPDYNDKEVRRLMTEAAIKSMMGIYGSETPALPAPEEMEGDVIDIPLSVDEEPENSEPKNGGEPTEEEVFSAMPEDKQIEILKAMAERKGYALKDLKFPVEQFTAVHRADFFKILNEMEDKVNGPDDGIPF